MEIQSVLVANRGEIALRVIRACREMGIRSIAVYAEPDRDSLHVQQADRALCIGPRDAHATYLNMDALLAVALGTGADAIHPGYGFLAESAEFAEKVLDAGLCWIGPSPDAIRRMGDKSMARATMRAAGVSVVPGSDGIVADNAEALRVAALIGYPVLIKATAGGGGKGMRVVQTPEELASAVMLARAEAGASFGDDGVYLERLLTCVRHIEVQVLGDSHGNAVHLWERDCSAQRRRQKLLEEAPAPGLPDEVRQQMGEAAVAAAKAVSYCGAGTVEFIYAPDSGEFYFMEMNTRIQVEHPITEAITGIDLVQAQIRVAAGEKLLLEQADIEQRGHSIECRINAENPETFMPNAGRIAEYHPPGGPFVRVDSHCYQGYTLPPFYDSLLAKVIVWAPTRPEAIARMDRALHEFTIVGLHTTISLQRHLLAHPRFQQGNVLTHSVESEMLMTDDAAQEEAR